MEQVKYSNVIDLFFFFIVQCDFGSKPWWFWQEVHYIQINVYLFGIPLVRITITCICTCTCSTCSFSVCRELNQVMMDLPKPNQKIILFYLRI